MIARISGQFVEKNKNSVILNVQGIQYEVLIPVSILQRIDERLDANQNLDLITYHYIQIGPSSGVPVLIGFVNEIEKDFFLQFITVSGIGPRAAVKALNQPISEISRAIDQGDVKFLKSLPGIGPQKAKEVIAKLQGKVGKYGLIQDRETMAVATVSSASPAWQEEALEVLLQLQYKKHEAIGMIQKAMARSSNINSAEELLNEIYKQRISS